ncbi:MAG: NADH-quinone oxidoreductase subunit J [Thermoanaerobacteraceae bacterium]|nr:NADH-quinone oxidoreductase subunit J [Thermoanaerobacteraceae bacterium]
MVVLLKNIVHSALFLVVTFVGVSATYVLLQADFLAAVQILVYAGAVSILLVFGVMLTVRGDIKSSNLFNRHKLSGGVVALALFLIVERIILKTEWVLSKNPAPESTVGPIAEAMLTKFVIPFEVAAILLLVAMVGAILLAKGEGKPQ